MLNKIKNFDIMGVVDAAAFLGLTASTINRAIQSGALAALKIGQTWVICREDLNDWNENRRGPLGNPNRGPGSRGGKTVLTQSNKPDTD